MSRTIIALDFENKQQTLEFLDKFKTPIYVKIGMELFYKEGPSIVKEIKARGHKIFLDLKVCDIPNTAKGAFKSLASLDIDMINLHIYGGSQMIQQAIQGLKEGSKDPSKLPLAIGVTILTSISEDILHNEIGIDKSIQQTAIDFAKLGKSAGLVGVVCSAFEAKKIHEEVDKDFITVCPGIRLASNSNNDQKRVATPSFARLEGCDYIVVGRSITKADDPYQAYLDIKKEFEGE